MNPDRLAELLRQRELVRQHLEWLDREIGAAGPTRPAPPSPVTGRPAAPAASGLPPAPEFANRLAGETGSEAYQPDPQSAALNARRGCFMIVGVAVLLLVALFTLVYLTRYRDRPLLFPTDERAPVENPAPARDAAPRK